MNINQKIVDMYNNPTYQELKDYYSKTTIFNVLGIERNERRHSAFLRWLFDNSSNHGLGEEPIKKILRIYALHMQRGENDALNILLMAGNYDLEITEIVTEKAIKKYSKNSNGYIDILVRMNLTEIEEYNNISVVLIIENKIDSGEGDNQTDDYHKYFEDTKESNEIPIEIYLTPEGAKGPNCKSFKHITYRELLKDVLLPLNRMVMPDEAKQIISDYIRNLSKPSVTENGKEYTVIATSEDEALKLKDIYNAFPDLYDAALIAGNMDQIIKTLGKVDNFREVVSFLNGLQLVDIASNNKKLTRDECIDLIQGMECRQLLEAFWNNNENLFKAILPQIEQMRIPVDRERIFKISHRDTSRYNVFAENKKYGLNVK